MAFALALLALSAAPAATPAEAGVPVVAAAGDIACARSAPHYNRGVGEGRHCRQQDTARLIADGRYAAVLALGDLMQNRHPHLRDFRTAYGSSWGRFKPRTYPVIGNHEYGYRNGLPYFDYFNGGRPRGRAGVRGQGWYSFDLGSWHLIALNANCDRHSVSCTVNSPQLRWLRADLAAHPADCTLAYWHQPAFSSGAWGEPQRVRQFWKALYTAGADVVLNAHDHMYERFAPQTPSGQLDRLGGIVQFTVGTGGYSLMRFTHHQPHSRYRQNRAFGILRLRLGRGGYAWRFLRAPGGGVLDHGRRRCSVLG
jgi:hypothetical protein